VSHPRRLGGLRASRAPRCFPPGARPGRRLRWGRRDARVVGPPSSPDAVRGGRGAPARRRGTRAVLGRPAAPRCTADPRVRQGPRSGRAVALRPPAPRRSRLDAAVAAGAVARAGGPGCARAARSPRGTADAGLARARRGHRSVVRRARRGLPRGLRAAHAGARRWRDGRGRRSGAPAVGVRRPRAAGAAPYGDARRGDRRGVPVSGGDAPRTGDRGGARATHAGAAASGPTARRAVLRGRSGGAALGARLRPCGRVAGGGVRTAVAQRARAADAARPRWPALRGDVAPIAQRRGMPCPGDRRHGRPVPRAPPGALPLRPGRPRPVGAGPASCARLRPARHGACRTGACRTGACRAGACRTGACRAGACGRRAGAADVRRALPARHVEVPRDRARDDPEGRRRADADALPDRHRDGARALRDRVRRRDAAEPPPRVALPGGGGGGRLHARDARCTASATSCARSRAPWIQPGRRDSASPANHSRPWRPDSAGNWRRSIPGSNAA